jgi:D-3-phosphoglycerate dehydrogenase
MDGGMRALSLAPFDREALAALAASGIETTVESWRDTKLLADPEELGARLHAMGAQVLITEADFVTEETFAAAPNLRLVGVCRGNVGMHVDLPAATEHGVLVLHTPGRNAVAVAELTLGLMLMLARRVLQADRLVRSGGWDSPLCAVHWGSLELAGKTAGLIGLGAVGREVARRLQALDVEVLAHDPYVRNQVFAKNLVSLEELLRRSDLVSVHCASTAETRGLIGAQELALMKPTAFLINTARAAIVDEAALIEALQAGRIAGAALDVFSVEPLPPHHPLLELDNVILTPHIGGAPTDVVRRHSWMLTRDILRWRRGERPLHLLNPGAWPGKPEGTR